MDARLSRLARLLVAATSRRLTLRLLVGSVIAALSAPRGGERGYPSSASAQTGCGTKTIRLNTADRDKQAKDTRDTLVRRLRHECYETCKVLECPPQQVGQVRIPTACALRGFKVLPDAINCKKFKDSDNHECKTDPQRDHAECQCGCDVCQGAKLVSIDAASDQKKTANEAFDDVLAKAHATCTAGECERYSESCPEKNTCKASSWQVRKERGYPCYRHEGKKENDKKKQGDDTYTCFALIESCTCGCVAT